MKEIYIYIIAFIAVLLLGGILGYTWAPKPDRDRAERLERRAYYDSLTIANRAVTIAWQSRRVDSLTEVNRYLEQYRYQFIKQFDTVYIRQLEQAEQDSAVKQALDDCIEMHRLNTDAISRLTVIRIEQAELIKTLELQVGTLTGANSNMDQLLIEYRTTNEYLTSKNRQLRHQRNITGIAAVGLAVGLYFLAR